MARQPYERLDELRQEIDRLDLDLLRLLNARAGIVLKILEYKRRMGLPLYSAARESEIIQQLWDHNEGPLSNEAVQDIFSTILGQSHQLMGI